MSYTHPTVNERLKMLIVNLEAALKGCITNEFVTRSRVDAIETDVRRLLDAAGLEPTPADVSDLEEKSNG